MGWTPQRGETVIDRGGTRFVLESEIARGGQGVVFTTQAEGAAVKLSTDNRDSRRQRVEDQIRSVARLPISDLPVALPRFTLAEPHVGYTMTLLTGMVSAESLARRNGKAPLLDWYVNSGGLRKRLRVVEGLARTMATLHARGLVYGDLSGNNVLVSDSPRHHRTFLIDLDNLRALEASGGTIWTPAYGAPEQRSGTTQNTDRFSLAVLAHWLLTTSNPFYGDCLDQMPPEDLTDPWSAIAAWIDDPEDESNRWAKGIPRTVVLSPRIQRLFAKTFTAGGDPGCRPHASEFALAARSALSAVVTCSDCRWDNYFRDATCASCRQPLQAAGYRILEVLGAEARPFRLRPFGLLDEHGLLEMTAASLGLPGRPDTVALAIHRGHRTATAQLRVADLSFPDQRSSGPVALEPDEQFVVSRRGRPGLLFVPLGEP